MRYRVYMSIAVEADDDREAYEHAKKLAELLKDPMLKFAVAGKGIQLSDDDGRPVVHQPQREF